jgi:hypothetical protein
VLDYFVDHLNLWKQTLGMCYRGGKNIVFLQMKIGMPIDGRRVWSEQTKEAQR